MVRGDGRPGTSACVSVTAGCVSVTEDRHPGDVLDDDMASLDQVFARLADDPTFADAIRTDPASALRGIDLSDTDLRRLEQFFALRLDLRSILGTEDS